MKQGNKLGKGRQVPVRPDGRPSSQNHGSLGSSDAPATGGGGGAEGERRLRRAGHCGTRCGPRGVGRKPHWVRPWRRGKSGRRSGLKGRSQARSPAATMAERPEDLNLPNAVITRIIKEAVSCSIWRPDQGRTSGQRETGAGSVGLLTFAFLTAPGRCQHLQGGPERHLPRRQRLRAVRHILVRWADLAEA